MRTNLPDSAILATQSYPAVSKRFSGGNIVSVLLVYLLTVVGLVQNADAQSHTVGLLTFRYIGGDYVEVSNCHHTASGSLVIPSDVQFPGYSRRFIVVGIGRTAFTGRSNLTSVSIPSEVTSIGLAAFQNCISLTSISMPSGVISIGEYAFSWCRSLTSITIPSGVTSIGDSVFLGCSSLTSIAIPSGVTSIGLQAFLDCSSLTLVTLSNSVTSIGDSVFFGCSSLPEITIPSGVTSIGSQAFVNCSSLTSITIPSGVTSIGASTFAGCSSLSLVILSNSVTSIGDSAFAGCSSLTNITIPSGVTSISAYTFAGCSSLSLVTLSNSVTSIGDSVFFGCISLLEITIPASVTSIGDGAFRGCSSLTSIAIPEGVTSIGYLAFGSCSSLTSITIPDNVISMDEGSFKDCTSLASVVVGKGVTSIAKAAFYNCSSLSLVTLSNSLTSIGDSAFFSCSSLPEITIPASVTSIGLNAFEACSQLEEITIPASVTGIGDGAFKDCVSLKTCFFLSNAPPAFGIFVFDLSSDFTIYYLSSSTGFTTPYWQGYQSLPVFPDSNKLGYVARIKGDVHATRNGETRRLQLRDEIYENDVITTATQSFVKISFDEGSNMNVGPKSRITVKFIHPLEPSVESILHKGFIRVYKAPNGKQLKVKSETVAIGVRGTTLTVEVSEENGMLTTTCEVLVGVVDYENLVTGEILELRTGESASSQAAPETHTLTLNHASASLGSLWLDGTEITSFPHIVTYAQGTELNLQAVPNATGVFATWTGGIVSTNPDYHLFLNEDVTVTGNFLPWTDFATEHIGLDGAGNANGNGLSNFLDYAAGQDPEAHNFLPIVGLSANVLTLHQRINGMDARPVAQYSDNLSDWFPLEKGVHYNFSVETATGARREVVIYLKAGQPANRFFRQAFEP